MASTVTAAERRIAHLATRSASQRCGAPMLPLVPQSIRRAAFFHNVCATLSGSMPTVFHHDLGTERVDTEGEDWLRLANPRSVERGSVRARCNFPTHPVRSPFRWSRVLGRRKRVYGGQGATAQLRPNQAATPTGFGGVATAAGRTMSAQTAARASLKAAYIADFP
jgi:hypothetical protein